MKSMRAWPGWRGVVGLGILAASCGVLAAAPRVAFSRDVRPVLSDKCFACHGPDTQKVKGGLRLDQRDSALRPAKSGTAALVPGDPSASELIRRIETADEDDRMPPASSHKSLSVAERELLRRWVAEGAEYQTHWAYVRPEKPAVPAVTHPVDFLVRSRLRELGLRPARTADRRTLARRLTEDLTGLPATAEAVQAFEKDSHPDAYDRLVERLLASPHHGERMAVGWLDVVRFADTIGYHSDNPRPIWPYRDYVIRAFNENKRFDQFTREQLAGDLLPQPTLEQKVASGFNRLLLTTEEGGAQPKDYEARQLTDRVRAVGAIWLGQTVGCAQCHDHKFDPITSRDFYSLGAFFADIQEPPIGSRGPGMLVPDAAQAAELKRLSEEATARQREFDGPHPQLGESYRRWQDAQLAAWAWDAAWTRLAPASLRSAGEATLKLRDDRSVLVSGKTPDKDVYTLTFTNGLEDITGLRVEALPDDSLPSRGPGRAGNGNFVLTEVVLRVERDGVVSRQLPVRSAAATFEQTLYADHNPYHRWSAGSVIDADAQGATVGWAVLPEVGRSQALVLRLDSPLSMAPDETLVLELRQEKGDEHHTLGCFRIAATVRADVADAAPLLPPVKELAELLQRPEVERDAAQRERLWTFYKDAAPELSETRAQLAEAKKRLADFESTVPRTLVTERQDPPRTVRILPRGNFLIETGDLVEPALPAFLSPTVAVGAPRRLTRLDLANWLVARDNPLTARVVMNRLWKQFFGTSLSKVMDDFGSQGEPPANAPLLDWLACEFMDSGWDVRHMVRLLVTSQTYRQRSTVAREAWTRDPDNREFARQGRWRLEAEFVRDQALAVAGLLVPTLGGPSVKPYQPEGYWENLNFPPRTYEASPGAAQYRRGLYTWWQRSFLHPSLLAFDAPSREECVADRTRSNIPQQALVLLNDPTYVEAARALAVRILRECRGDAGTRVRWGWRQVLARNPRADEVRVLRAIFERHRDDYRRSAEAAAAYLKIGATPPPADLDPAELAAWTDVARALLNLHETLTRS